MKLEKLKLLDYENNEYNHELQNKPVDYIIVVVVSGDELATVVYKDRTMETFGSAENRMADFFDSYYIIENDEQLKEWSLREDTYDYEG